MLTNESNCILSQSCRMAATESCTKYCEAYVRTKPRVHAANLPAKYQTTILETSPVREGQLVIYDRLLGTGGQPSYVSTFERYFDDGRIKSLYLYSESPGTGKTTTACGILNAYISAYFAGCIKRGMQIKERPAFFLDVPEFQGQYNKFNRRHVPQETAETASRNYYLMLEHAKQADFLVMDDIGIRDVTAPFLADMHDIINYRSNREVPTVYTSNIPITELAHMYGQRLYDRIRDKCVIWTFEGGSHRGNR